MEGINKRRVLAVAMAVTLVMSLLPVCAYAATWTKKSLKTIYSYDSVATQVQKSAKIKKMGRYNLVFKGGNGIVKFTAPKTKKYSFTFSNLKSGETNDVGCVVGFCSVTGSSYKYKTGIATKEGKRPRLPIVSASMANGKRFQLDGYTYKSLKSRTGSFKLKKGQSVFVVIQAKDMDDCLVSSAMRMRIA